MYFSKGNARILYSIIQIFRDTNGGDYVSVVMRTLMFLSQKKNGISYIMYINQVKMYV